MREGCTMLAKCDWLVMKLAYWLSLSCVLA